MLDWPNIDTVLLDMDGTLLDLRFDNHFWQEFVPLRFAKQRGLSLIEAKTHLVPKFKSKEGSLEWYCLDYWSEELQLDIAALKAEVAELIRVLPHVDEFMQALRQTGKRVLLVTNAHRDSLQIKTAKTGIADFFDKVISSHDLGLPKENSDFWVRLHQQEKFNKDKVLFIDDSLTVLRSAWNYGIKELVCISKPDSTLPVRHITEFRAVEDFRALLPGVLAGSVYPASVWND